MTDLLHGVATDDPLQALAARLGDEALWSFLIERCLPPDCGLSWRDGAFEYAPEASASGALKLRAGLDGGTGLAVSLEAKFGDGLA